MKMNILVKSAEIFPQSVDTNQAWQGSLGVKILPTQSKQVLEQPQVFPIWPGFTNINQPTFVITLTS